MRGKQKYDQAPPLERCAAFGAGGSKDVQAVGRRERNAGSQVGEALEMPNSREEVQLQCQGPGWREEGVEEGAPAVSSAPSPSGLATAEPGPVVACLAMAWDGKSTEESQASTLPWGGSAERFARSSLPSAKR